MYTSSVKKNDLVFINPSFYDEVSKDKNKLSLLILNIQLIKAKTDELQILIKHLRLKTVIFMQSTILAVRAF